MPRINIYRYPSSEPTDPTYFDAPAAHGWFDPEAATSYAEGARWDGSNHVGLCSGSQWIDETLWRTAGGRWILNRDARRYHNGEDRYWAISDDEARAWLIRSEYPNDEIEAATGDPMPAEMGRPEIGPPLKIRFPREIIDQLDARATATGTSRAAVVREAVEAHLADPVPATQTR